MSSSGHGSGAIAELAPLPPGMRTRGQPSAVAALRAMLAHGVPHAVLLTGPAGVGKTTLALDLAAALLCVATDRGERPCGECRGCRMVEHGNHPDLHRLSPVGPGAVIPIGGRDERGVRDLVAELAFLPVEGGPRVAIVEGAHRLTEDAQSAFLKTLEEPPAGTTIVLCADDEERLLPTIRSRCVRVRLGPLGSRDIEGLLSERALADPSVAARLARLAGGRPGVAVAYALAPDARLIRVEIARTLLDLLTASRTRRLTLIRDLALRAANLAAELDAGMARAVPGSGAAGASRRARGRGGRPPGRQGVAGTSEEVGSAASASALEPSESRTSDAAELAPDAAAGSVDESGVAAARVPAAERRRGALALVAIWRDLLRDLAIVGLGDPRSVVDTDLLDDLEAATDAMPPLEAAAFLRRLDVAGERLEGNVSPELVLDVLALAWRTGTAS